MPGRFSTGGFSLGRMKMPGRELPDDSVWQVVESEIMKPEDYDTIIEKGYNAFYMSALPRVIDDQKAVQENLAWIMANGARKLQEFQNHGYVLVSGMGLGVPGERCSRWVRSL